MNPARPATSAIALTLAFAVAPPAATEFTTVALTGQQVPGAEPGVVFQALGSPVLNAAGDTAFLATMTGPGVDESNDRGFYSQRTGTLNHVAREGDQAPGAAPGVVFAELSFYPAFNAAGHTAFAAPLSGTDVDDSNNYAIYSNATGVLNEVARTGGQAPDADPGVVFRRLNEFGLGPAGDTAFEAQLTGPGVDRLSGNQYGIYRDTVGTLNKVAREGNPGSEAAPNTVVGEIAFTTFNAAGEATFDGRLDSTNGDPSYGSGIFSEVAGTFQRVAQRNVQVPDAAPGVTISSITGLAPGAAGQLAFLARLNGTDADGLGNFGIYSQGPDGLRKIAREGEQAPDAAPGVVFQAVKGASNFFTPPPTHMTSTAGETAFYAWLTGPGVDSTNDVGIYSEDTGMLREVARAGGQAPAASPGVVFSDFDGFELNAAGQTAFEASLTGAGVTDANDEGIYAIDLDGQLTEIVRNGQSFDVNQDPLIDDLRTVEWAQLLTPVRGLLNNGLNDSIKARESSFNERGQIAFRAKFTDGTSGVFISNAVANLALVFGDLDNDGDADIDDVNLLAANLGVGTTPDQGDIDADGDVDLADLDAWLALIDTVNGDANLDLEVGTADLAILAGNFFNPSPTYAHGDFDLDGQITTADLAILAGAFGSGEAAVVARSAPTPLVPEPASVVFVGLAGLAVAARRRA